MTSDAQTKHIPAIWIKYCLTYPSTPIFFILNPRRSLSMSAFSYDPCSSPFPPLLPCICAYTSLLAGQLVYTDPDTGVVSVYNGGDSAWVLASTALVWLMIPGVGFFYSGLLRRKNALSLIYLSVAVVGVISFEVGAFSSPLPYHVSTEFHLQWFFWGYSLAFSDNANGYIGDLKHFALMDVNGKPSMGSPRIPALVFAIYQCMFAVIT